VRQLHQSNYRNGNILTRYQQGDFRQSLPRIRVYGAKVRVKRR
jgi:hypothetical protein